MGGSVDSSVEDALASLQQSEQELDRLRHSVAFARNQLQRKRRKMAEEASAHGLNTALRQLGEALAERNEARMQRDDWAERAKAVVDEFHRLMTCPRTGRVEVDPEKLKTADLTKLVHNICKLRLPEPEFVEPPSPGYDSGESVD